MIRIINRPGECSVMIRVNYQLDTLFTKEHLQKLLYDDGGDEVLYYIHNTILREISTLLLNDLGTTYECESMTESVLLSLLETEI